MTYFARAPRSAKNASVCLSEAAANVPSVPPGANSTVTSRGQLSNVAVGTTVNPASLVTGSNVLETMWMVAPIRAPNMQ
ncbi:hypothetical protein D3C87_1882820 [compost metagenome]